MDNLRNACVNRARSDMWEPWARNRPGPPGPELPLSPEFPRNWQHIQDCCRSGSRPLTSQPPNTISRHDPEHALRVAVIAFMLESVNNSPRGWIEYGTAMQNDYM